MSHATDNKRLTGGEFLFRETKPEDIFIPEDFDEEQLMIAAACQNFVEQRVMPVISRIDAAEAGLIGSLIKEAGELGLPAISISEEYGGFGKDLVTSMLVGEKTGPTGSFSIAFMVHTGVGTLPILYYGNEEQKQKYLPKLATGQLIGAYCLTEPGAGSDANAGKTKATLSSDGKCYHLNGQKIWITNAGFADLFIVFAKIENDKNLSAFIVEKSFPGISLSPEEQKMGLKGSSTRQVFFNDCEVPVGNLLSGRDKGFKIALNTLNTGRLKLGAVALGYAKSVITNAVRFANEREQFARSISKYGAVNKKLAEQAIHAYATESAIYRVSQNIEDAVQELIAAGMGASEAKLKGAESFAVEAAIIKVYATEALDFIVDEGVQIYGGMGYSAEAPMERAYRDSRVYRIFEGTNEINRLLIVELMLKRNTQGRSEPNEAANKGQAESREPEDLFGKERIYIANFKKAILSVSKAAIQKYASRLVQEQEIVMCLADMLIDTYVSESFRLRVEKLAGRGGDDSIREQIDMMQVYIRDAGDRIFKAGKEALNAFATGEEHAKLITKLKGYTETEAINTTEARRRIAAKLIEKNQYCY